MKRLPAFATASIFLILPAIAGTPAAQAEVQGIPCQGKPKLYDNGRIETCILARDHTLSGYVLPAGSELVFTKEGSLRRCMLGQETAFHGQPLPAGTKVFFNPQGRMRSFWLREPTVIQGHLLPASTDGVGNSLHPNGRLRAIWLTKDVEIDGVPCTSSMNLFRMGLRVMKLGTQRMAWFHENGRLQQAMLSRDFTIQGHAFRKGEIISLGPDGKVDLGAAKLQ